MATPATIWATNAGAGAADGTSLADAYALANAVTAVNGLGALSQDLTVRVCGDCTIAAALAITKDATSTHRIIWQGRNAGDTANAEVEIDANDGAHDVWTLTTADKHEFHQIHALNTDEAAGHDGWAVGANADACAWYKSRASHCHRGWNLDANSTYDNLVECRSHNNADAGVYGNATTHYYGSVTHNNGAEGFKYGFPHRCLAYANGAEGFYVHGQAISSIARGNGASGFRCSPTTPFVGVDCIATDNGAYGWYSTSVARTILLRCGSYNNTSGRIAAAGTTLDVDDPSLTADPFINAGAGDFRLNKAAGGGALLRGLGFTFPGGLTTGYHDIGAAQHQAAMSGIVRGVIVQG